MANAAAWADWHRPGHVRGEDEQEPVTPSGGKPGGQRAEDTVHVLNVAVCATLSATVGTPSTRTPPPAFGISTARTGGGKYVPDDIRFHTL